MSGKRRRKSPRDAFLDGYVDAAETRTVASLSHALREAGLLPEDCGRNNLYGILRRMGMLRADNLPTKEAVERGYAVTETLDLRDYGDRLHWREKHYRPRITQSGIRAVVAVLDGVSSGLFAAPEKKADETFKPLF